MTTLILIRHGETTGNVDGLWHGRLDAPLTERGRLQVQAVACRLAALEREEPVDAFYVSPLARAQSTAAAIAEALGKTPRVDAGLAEFDLGDWEGRSFVELRDQEDLWEHWKRDPSFAPPNGESPISFGQRVAATFHRLSDQHPGQRLVVVSHGGVLSNLLAMWLGETHGEWRRWEPHNCSITILKGEGNRWHGALINDVSHLPPEVVVEKVPQVWDE